MKFTISVLLIALVACTQGWVIDDGCLDRAEYLTSIMRTAFQWARAARDNLNAIAAGGYAHDPLYIARLDLLRYVFSLTLWDNTTAGPDSSAVMFESIRSTYTQILEFDQLGNGMGFFKPDWDLGLGQLLMYCDYDRITLQRDCFGRIAPGRACDTENDMDLAFTDYDIGCMTASLSSNPESAWSVNGHFYGKTSILQICDYILQETYSRRFDMADIFNDIAILARSPDDVNDLMQQVGFPRRPAVEIITVSPVAPVLHQLTQVLRHEIEDVNDGDCYGWSNVLKFSPYGADADYASPMAAQNSQSYVYFAIGSALIAAQTPQRVNADGSISLIYPEYAKRSHESVKGEWRPRSPDLDSSIGLQHTSPTPSASTPGTRPLYSKKAESSSQPTISPSISPLKSPSIHRPSLSQSRGTLMSASSSSGVVSSASDSGETKSSSKPAILSSENQVTKSPPPLSSTKPMETRKPSTVSSGLMNSETPKSTFRSSSKPAILSSENQVTKSPPPLSSTKPMETRKPSSAVSSGLTNSETPKSTLRSAVGASSSAPLGSTSVKLGPPTSLLAPDLATSRSISTASSTTAPSTTVVPVILSGKTSRVTYVSTYTSSGSIGPTAAWMCSGPLCDHGGGCLIPLFCRSSGGGHGHGGLSIGASWGLCCEWEPSIPDVSPGGPSPGPAEQGDDKPNKGDGNQHGDGNESEKPTASETKTATTQSSSGTSTSTGSSHSTTQSSSHSTSTGPSSSHYSSCSETETATSCAVTIQVLTPYGSSSATTVTVTETCSTIQGCQATNQVSTITSAAKSSSIVTATPDDYNPTGLGPSYFQKMDAVLSMIESKDGPRASSLALKASKSPSIRKTAAPSRAVSTHAPPKTSSTHSSTALPTNVPGVGGVPGCSGVVSAPGTSAYCECDGIAAPTLKATASGHMNCDYTILPSKGYNPKIPKSTTDSRPSSATGRCNVHVQQGLGEKANGPAMYVDANITDAHGKLVGAKLAAINWSGTVQIKGELPYVLLVTPQLAAGSSLKCQMPACEPGGIDFSYHSQDWNSNSPQCSVGPWGRTSGPADEARNHLLGNDFDRSRQMDCKFDCS